MNLIRIESESLTAEVNPHGAELYSVKSNDGTEYIWQAGPAWTRHAPVLFPIVGRLKENTYYYKDKKYTLSQHGFARDRLFTLVDKSPASCTFELLADDKSLENYPFRFRLRITYTIAGNSVTCKYEVVNAGTEVMFFSIGAHPGFCYPLTKGEQLGDFHLVFEKHALLQTGLDDGLRTNDTKVVPMQGKTIVLTPTLFDSDALVFENGQVEKVSLVSKVSGRGVTMECEGWPYFGIWSKKGNQEFVCLEPWYGVADSIASTQKLEEKDGIIRLEAGAAFLCHFSFTIT